MKEIEVAGPRAVFFQIGKCKIDDYGMVNIQLAAKILKANPDKKYKIAGYADIRLQVVSSGTRNCLRPVLKPFMTLLSKKA